MGIICLSPVLMAISLWIYKDSPGPIIFKHRRVGRNGKEFNCYKFRSMCVDADVKLKELLARDPQARKEWETEFKLKRRPAHHQKRRLPAQNQPGRTAAIIQRPQRRNEPRRPTPHHPGRSSQNTANTSKISTWSAPASPACGRPAAAAIHL
jgi:hypothetical protein